MFYFLPNSFSLIYFIFNSLFNFHFNFIFNSLFNSLFNFEIHSN